MLNAIKTIAAAPLIDRHSAITAIEAARGPYVAGYIRNRVYARITPYPMDTLEMRARYRQGQKSRRAVMSAKAERDALGDLWIGLDLGAMERTGPIPVLRRRAIKPLSTGALT